MNVKMAVLSNDNSLGSNAAVQRTYGNINRSYIIQIGSPNYGVPIPVEPLPTPLIPNGDGRNYASFWAWADAVARALNSFSNNTYIDTTITATFSTTEELNA